MKRDIQGLQALRALAAIAVVVHHGFAEVGGHDPLNFGALGVQTFFVISGFIMEWSTRPYSTIDGALNFSIKRAIRVIPLYWLVTGILTAMLIRANQEVSLSRFAMSLLFIPHFSPEPDGGISPILMPGWTLNFEMFFYFIFAVAGFLGERRVIALTAIMVPLVFLGMTLSLKDAISLTYTSPLLLEFLLGAWLAKNIVNINPMGKLASFLMACTGIVIFFYAENFVGNAVIAWSGRVTGVVLIAVPFALLASMRGFFSGLLIELGNASYSIYLWHTILMHLIYKYLVAPKLNPESPYHSLVALPLIAILAIFASWLAYIFIEKPMLSKLKGIVGRGSLKPAAS